MRLVFFCFLYLCGLLYVNVHLTNQSANSSMHAVFISIPLAGHLTPLICQAEALVLRGWKATIVTSDEARGFVLGYIDSLGLQESLRNNLRTEFIGNLTDIEIRNNGADRIVIPSTEDEFTRISGIDAFIDGATEIIKWTFQVWRPMFDGWKHNMLTGW